ncbi:dehydrogenase/reductase SDR family member 13-like [Aplochiton taeniatus]
MATLFIVAGLVVTVYLVVYNLFVKGAVCKSHVKLHGKTAIVTGSNTGIGKMTALDLAKRGARVILACRNQRRAESALAEIKRESGSNEVVFMQLDLGSLRSVRSFAETFLMTESRLDLLINNAGIYLQSRTEDGFGMMFGVNHLGPFLLTNLLLDRLKECGPSRIVNVSSAAHNVGAVDFNLLNTHKELGIGQSFTKCLQTYSNSKLCNVLFTHELAKKLQGTQVTCYSLHPGFIKTELTRYASDFSVLLFTPAMMLFSKNTVQGSQTTLHCALQEGIEPLSGRYFSNCTVRSVYRKAKDDLVARKLWEVSERLSGLS